MIAAHPAARVRLDLRLRAAELTCALHDPRFGRDRRAEVDTLAALRTARAAAAHVARLAAPPAHVLGHPMLPLWSPPVTGPWPTCALCDAPVERMHVTLTFEAMEPADCTGGSNVDLEKSRFTLALF